mgnify:CR=1 FL=1
MIRILLFSALWIISITTKSQTMKYNYKQAWKKVDSLLEKGLNTSAEEDVLKIWQRAKADMNTEQIIRSMITYRLTRRNREEEARIEDMILFEKELANARFPLSNFLHSMLAELYKQYYDEHRWEMMDRVQVKSSTPLSVASVQQWASQDFYSTISAHYKASIADADRLSKYQIKDFGNIIVAGKNTENLRWSLYDFLIHRAIDFYTDDQVEWSSIVDKFKLTDSMAFAKAEDWVKYALPKTDTQSRQYLALSMYQDIIRTHLTDSEPSALIDVDIARMQYCHRIVVPNDKDKWYYQALEAIVAKYPTHPIAAEAAVLMAKTFMDNTVPIWNKRYNKNQRLKEDKNDYVAARTILEPILINNPNTKAHADASALIEEIEQKILQVETEKIVSPSENILAKITFRNVPKVYFKLVSLSTKDFRDYSMLTGTDLLQKLLYNSSREWHVSLPLSDDYKQHSTEIKIDSLAIGRYALIASEHPQFLPDNLCVISYIQVSSLSYVLSSVPSEGTYCYVLDRSSGEPLTSVIIKTSYYNYDYTERKNKYTEASSYVSDKEGKVLISSTQSKNVNFELIKGRDTLIMLDHNYIVAPNRKDADREQVHTYFFTDRSIYRPGQTIYFKGIMISKSQKTTNTKLLANTTCTVVLKDVNGQEVSKLKLKTNEYGSFTASMIAPVGLLTGTFEISNESGQQYIQIEEYKRPKFEVLFDTLKESFGLYDNVRVTGTAKAYAGNSLEGAKVVYRVVREARYPYYWCFYRWGLPESPSVLMTEGVVYTTSSGAFEIDFAAIPDEAIRKEAMPIFQYTVYADVTDINGETHSAEIKIDLSYQEIILSVEAPSMIDVNKFNTIKVYTKNMAGQYVPKQVNIRLNKLRSPTQLRRSRLWAEVDMPSMSEDDFRKYFPNDEYQQENKKENWPIDNMIWEKTLETSKDALVYLQKIAPEQGWYVLEVNTIDSKGTTIVEKKYIRILTQGNYRSTPTEPILCVQNQTVYEPGDQVNVKIATPVSTHILWQKDSESGISTHYLLQPSEATAAVLVNQKIAETDRGGFWIHALYVYQNRFYKHSEAIQVPWSNKELNIRLETYRDKMLPGSDQKWKLHISGAKKEKVSAELIAGMYDASLDALMSHQWGRMSLFTKRQAQNHISTGSNFSTHFANAIFSRPYMHSSNFEKTYPSLQWYDLLYGHSPVFARFQMADNTMSRPVMEAAMQEGSAIRPSVKFTPPQIASDADPTQKEKKSATDKEETKLEATESIPISVRKDFKETAFFFPQLQTDENGDILLQFTAPEALTRWKMQAFAHTQSLETASLTTSAVTQKDLMIVPNTPRFIREGDHMIYSAKVTNLSQQGQLVDFKMDIYDAISMQQVNDLFQCKQAPPQYIASNSSVLVVWNIRVPSTFIHPVLVRTVAQSATLSDGEENTIPVVLNSMLVTETLPLMAKSGETKKYTFDKLKQSSSSNTLRHHALTVEYTANPAWYAVQSLPYLTDYPYECAEQTFNRFYANSLAAHIAHSNPKISDVISKWNTKDSASFVSALEKNQELKSALLQETPWVLQAKNETEQMKQLALLFDLNRMSKELHSTLRELERMQTPNGGFAWFKGMPDDHFVTLYIVSGIGRLQKLGGMQSESISTLQTILERAMPYLDARMHESYQLLKKRKIDMASYPIDYFELYYLYMRSMFDKNYALAPNHQEAYRYYSQQAAKQWLQRNKYMQAMSALLLHRQGNSATAQAIVASLRENAIHHPELGMYWKDNSASYWWYEAPIETQSMMIELFAEVAKDQEAVDKLKIWLLKNKQTNHWSTTKATADACYALLLQGTYWLAARPAVQISLGDRTMNTTGTNSIEGSGYVKMNIEAQQIKSTLGDITLTVKNTPGTGQGIKASTWGAIYWQYFENLDKIASAQSPLSISKNLFIVKNTDKGEQLIPVNEGDKLQVGDKVKVRLQIRSDRAMEYIHLKDMRAACFEPTAVLSQYNYQGGLGYYEATKDLASHFFFHRIEKGQYILEYNLFATHEGNFSNGLATIQCMYAPEFASHSEGLRVEVTR